MAPKLKVPLDQTTVEGLRKLGKDIVTSKTKREAFLGDPRATMESYGVQNIDLNKLDKNVVAMLADPRLQQAVETKNVEAVRAFVQESLDGKVQMKPNFGTFDFDFDVEVEVEVIVVAIAVFDFAATQTKIPDLVELQKRRAIVAQAFESIGKKIQ